MVGARAGGGRRGGRGDGTTRSARPRRPGPAAGCASNGSEFTVDSLARYHLHDVLHHTHDVRDTARGPRWRRTTATRATTATRPGSSTTSVRAELDAFAAAVGAGGAVLEIGSAGGRDALALEERGLTRAPYRRHAGLRRADAQPRVRRRRARPADRRPRAGRTTASGPAPACCTSPARTSRWCCAASPRRPGRAACSPCRSRRATARGGRRTVTSGAAAVRLLARGAAARGARRRRLAGATRSTHGTGGCGRAVARRSGAVQMSEAG